MAKYSLPEMFGQLPDIVMQGFSDPEDIMNIADTGQPAKMEEAILPVGEGTGLPDSGDIYGDVLNMTNNPMLADMAASGTASDELIQAVLTDLTPSPTTLRVEQAAQAVINAPQTQSPLEDLITAYSRTYGVSEASLKNAVTRIERQQDEYEKEWWREEGGGLPTFEPEPFVIDPKIAIEDVLENVAISESTRNEFFESPIIRSPDTPSDASNEENAVKEFLSKAVDNVTGVVKDALTDYGKTITTDIGAHPDHVTAVPGFGPSSDESLGTDRVVDITSPTTTDQLVKTIQQSESLIKDPAVTPTAEAITQPTGTGIEYGTEKFNTVIRAIGNNSFGPPVQRDKRSDGSEMFTYINPNTQDVYNVTGMYGPNVQLWDLGKLELLKSGDVLNEYTLDGDRWDYNKQLNLFAKPQTAPSMDAGDAGMPTTGGLYGLSRRDQWDALRAREMGDDAFNPVLWGNRDYGYRPAAGQFLLSGGLSPESIQSQPFYEWLPGMKDRDRSQDWANLVTASQLSADPSKWSGIEGEITDPRNMQLRYMNSVMQGDAAKSNILSMVSTAMGAGEGYASESLRKHLSDLYDLYAAQSRGKAQPVGGFAAWIDERRSPNPGASTIGYEQSTTED